MGRVLRQGQWTIVIASALVAALFFAWQLLSAANFCYPFWYRELRIDRTIGVYGPQNRYRKDFALTTPAERSRLFFAIVKAVNDGGRGLESIRYHDRQGRRIDTLLRAPEIQHLRDVARLIGAFHVLGWIAVLTFAVALLSLMVGRASKPPGMRLFAYMGVTVLVAVGLVVGLGPERVFYRFHTWIFPAGHQWFFYYQDSLMTTLMKAPDLFAGIAAEWLLLAIGLFVALLVPCLKLAAHRYAKAGPS